MSDLPTEAVLEFKTAAKSKPRSELLVKMTIDGEAYYALAIQPAAVSLDIAKFEDASNGEKARIYGDFLSSVLTDDSAARLEERMRSKTEPIDLAEVGAVIKGLVEEVYGKNRPLESASSSPNG